jgi:outer membrane protein OmpA-like peptidoglycan-associated protein
MYLANTVFALILSILISASLQSPTFAAEIIEPNPKPAAEIIKPKPKPKPDTLGGFSVSTTIGSYFFAGSEQRNVTPLYGVKVGYEKIGKSVAENLGLEATLNYFSASSKADARDATGYLFRLDASYPFPIKKTWIPYLVIGAGGIFSDANGTTNKNFLLNYGLGVKYFIQNYLAFRVDARHVGVYENSIFRQNVDVGVGLSYYFGKERVKKPVVSIVPPVPEKKKIEILEDEPAKKVEVKTDKSEKPADDVPAIIALPPGKIEVVKKMLVEFDTNSSYVKPTYFNMFKEIAASLNASDDLAVHIDGSTGTVGESDTTINLLEKRVQNVRSSLIKLGVNLHQMSIKTSAAALALPVTGAAKSIGKQQNRSMSILLVKLDDTAKLRAVQEFQFEIERNEIERLQIETRAKERVKATLELHEMSGALPVDSAGSLAFQFVNKGEDTEEFMLMLVVPKDFDSFVSTASRPDEKVTLLQLAPGEKFNGNVRFRIPAGMVDGQKATLTLKAVSTRFNDVVFQQESQIVASAPLLRLEAKLASLEVSPGEKLLYRLTIINSGSLSARALTIKLPLPSQVDFVGASGALFTQDVGGTLIFKIDAIENGKRTEITIDGNVRADSVPGQELLWNAEVIDGTLQRRAKSTERALIVRTK